MRVILAQGKTGLLGNDGNNVTRQDEPRARFLSGGHNLGCGSQGGRGGQWGPSLGSGLAQRSSWLRTLGVQSWLLSSLFHPPTGL